MKRKILNFIFKTFLFSSGLIIVAFILWSRLLRERLPREIPFELSILGVVCIIFICILYLSNIYLYLFATNGQGSENKHLIKFSKIINKPLIFLDNTLKNNSIISKYFDKSLIYFITNFQNIFYKIPNERELIFDKYPDNRFMQHMYYLFKFPFGVLYMILDVYPRIVLLVALLIDVFIYKQIYYFYMLFPIGILIFVSKYLHYCIKEALEKYLLIVEDIDEYVYANVPFEEKYDDPISLLATGKFRTTRYFMWLQTLAFMEKNIKYKVQISKIYELYGQTSAQIAEDDLLDQKFNKLMYEIVVPLCLFEFEFSCGKEYSISQRIKGCIFLGFLICWMYILVVSFPYAELPIMDVFLNEFFIQYNLFI